jgi:hypothetical protein
MATKTIVCPECDAGVPYGRLSCPSCGALLASVAGSFRRFSANDLGTSVGLSAPTPATEAVVPSPARSTPSLPDVTVVVDPEPVAADEASSDDAGWDDEQVPDASADAIPEPTRPWASLEPSTAARWAAGPQPGAQPIPASGADSANADPVRTWTFAPEPGGTTSIQSVVHEPLPTVGAYVPPAPMPVAPPDLPPAQFAARAWIPGGAAAAENVAAPEGSDHAGRVDRVEQATGWVTAAGSALAALGFVLPWSPNVIGSTGFGSYLDTWGLANPTHLVVFAAVLALLGLAFVSSPIGSWIRSGLLALVFGGLLVGLAWPYAPGPLGAGLGIYAVLAGALLLVAAGVATASTHRHSPIRPPV